MPIAVYDETIGILQSAVQKAKIGQSDKLESMKKLHELARRAEDQFTPSGAGLEEWIAQERADSWKYGGRTVFGRAKPPASSGPQKPTQLMLF